MLVRARFPFRAALLQMEGFHSLYMVVVGKYVTFWLSVVQWEIPT